MVFASPWFCAIQVSSRVRHMAHLAYPCLSMATSILHVLLHGQIPYLAIDTVKAVAAS